MSALLLLCVSVFLCQSALAQDDNPFDLFRDSFTVNFGDFEADAQITYPAHGDGPFPTVILIHGS
ncbi:MAG: hypothetical protein H7175_13035, partial [Burkholderiales bacterium]|nr:hypothetical protein [Anaerolineae bacterium]